MPARTSIHLLHAWSPQRVEETSDPLNWSYRRLGATILVLEIKTLILWESSPALGRRAVSPALTPLIFVTLFNISEPPTLVMQIGDHLLQPFPHVQKYLQRLLCPLMTEMPITGCLLVPETGLRNRSNVYHSVLGAILEAG